MASTGLALPASAQPIRKGDFAAGCCDLLPPYPLHANMDAGWKLYALHISSGHILTTESTGSLNGLLRRYCSPASCLPWPVYYSLICQHLMTRFGYEHCFFPLCRRLPISSANSPIIAFICYYVGFSHIYHRLHSKNKSWN